MTYHPKSEFLDVMIRRGYMADCTDLQCLDAALIAGIVPAYIGYDSRSRSWGAARRRWATPRAGTPNAR